MQKNKNVLTGLLLPFFRNWYKFQLINSISLKLGKIRIEYMQNKVERIVKADKAQNLMEVYFKKGIF